MRVLSLAVLAAVALRQVLGNVVVHKHADTQVLEPRWRFNASDHDHRRVAVGVATLAAEGVGLYMVAHRFVQLKTAGKRDISDARRVTDVGPLSRRTTKAERVGQWLMLYTGVGAVAMVPLRLAAAAVTSHGQASNQPKTRSLHEEEAPISAIRRGSVDHDEGRDAPRLLSRGRRRFDLSHVNWDKHSEKLELGAGVVTVLNVPFAVALYQKATSDYHAQHAQQAGQGQPQPH